MAGALRPFWKRKPTENQHQHKWGVVPWGRTRELPWRDRKHTGVGGKFSTIWCAVSLWSRPGSELQRTGLHRAEWIQWPHAKISTSAAYGHVSMPLSEDKDLKRKEAFICPCVAGSAGQINTGIPGLPMLKSRVQGHLSEALGKPISFLKAATQGTMGQNQARQVPACRKCSTEDKLIVMLENAVLNLWALQF